MSAQTFRLRRHQPALDNGCKGLVERRRRVRLEVVRVRIVRVVGGGDTYNGSFGVDCATAGVERFGAWGEQGVAQLARVVRDGRPPDSARRRQKARPG